ncbi:hypothetical protein Ancab_025545 [Ancistrocladus abbreviatus]
MHTDRISNLVVTTKSNDRAWPGGCLVREIKSLAILEGLEIKMENEGANGYRIWPFKGNLVLLSVKGVRTVEELVARDKTKLDRWFDTTRPWEENDVRNRRMAWMRNIRKLIAKLTKANSSHKSQGIVQAVKRDDNKCCRCCKKDKANLGHSKRIDNEAGLNLMYNVGLGLELHSSSKACIPAQEAGPSLSNSEDEVVRSMGELEGLKAYQVEPSTNITKAEVGGKTSPNKWKKVYYRRQRIKKKNLKEIIAREPRS